MNIKKILKNPWLIGAFFFLLGLPFIYKGYIYIQTKGNYSPGFVEGDYIGGDKVEGDKIEAKTEEYKKFPYEVSPLDKGDSLYYIRTIKIWNNTNSNFSAFHFSVKCDRPIEKASPFPLIEGGIIQINYDRTTGNTYEAEVGPLAPYKWVMIALRAKEPFEVESVHIYNQ